jgi:hypothetical protein
MDEFGCAGNVSCAAVGSSSANDFTCFENGMESLVVDADVSFDDADDSWLQVRYHDAICCLRCKHAAISLLLVTGMLVLAPAFRSVWRWWCGLL